MKKIYYRIMEYRPAKLVSFFMLICFLIAFATVPAMAEECASCHVKPESQSSSIDLAAGALFDNNSLTLLPSHRSIDQMLNKSLAGISRINDTSVDALLPSHLRTTHPADFNASINPDDNLMFGTSTPALATANFFQTRSLLLCENGISNDLIISQFKGQCLCGDCALTITEITINNQDLADTFLITSKSVPMQQRLAPAIKTANAMNPPTNDQGEFILGEYGGNLKFPTSNHYLLAVVRSFFPTPEDFGVT